MTYTCGSVEKTMIALNTIISSGMIEGRTLCNLCDAIVSFRLPDSNPLSTAWQRVEVVAFWSLSMIRKRVCKKLDWIIWRTNLRRVIGVLSCKAMSVHLWPCSYRPCDDGCHLLSCPCLVLSSQLGYPLPCCFTSCSCTTCVSELLVLWSEGMLYCTYIHSNRLCLKRLACEGSHWHT